MLSDNQFAKQNEKFKFYRKFVATTNKQKMVISKVLLKTFDSNLASWNF